MALYLGPGLYAAPNLFLNYGYLGAPYTHYDVAGATVTMPKGGGTVTFAKDAGGVVWHTEAGGVVFPVDDARTI